MAHFPAFRKLINDMLENGIDRDHFKVIYAKVTFDIIISIDAIPYEFLIGGQGINWACIMEMPSDFEMAMPDSDFYRLRDCLDLQSNGIEKFVSYIFLKHISKHAPHVCSGIPVQPQVMQRWYSNRDNIVDPENRNVFYRWVDQNKRNSKAHNFDKTEAYFGKNVADYCRQHNITSQWLTPEQALGMNIKTVEYPWKEYF